MGVALKDLLTVLGVAAIILAVILGLPILLGVLLRVLLRVVGAIVSRRGRVTIQDPSVLLLDLSSGRDSGIAGLDREIYGTGFGAVTESKALESLHPGVFVIVHLFVRPDDDGLLAGLKPDAFFKLFEGPSLVVVASEGDGRIVPGLRLPYNLVVTFERRGDRFGSHFRKLYSLMFSGRTLADAWISLSPQNPDRQDDGSEPLLMWLPNFPNLSFKCTTPRARRPPT
jgi:hypothetical protein